jgi:hypothetical protein
MLKKSRTRDPRAAAFDGYMIVDPEINGVVAGGHPWAYSLNLDEVEEWAKMPPPEDTIGIGSRVEWDLDGHHFVGICKSRAVDTTPNVEGVELKVSLKSTDWFVTVMSRDGYRSNLAHPVRVPESSLRIRYPKTTGELRDALADAAVQIATGQMEPKEAEPSLKFAKEANKSMKAKIKEARKTGILPEEWK